MRILLLSIVNPNVVRNGAATVTRGLLKMLALPPLEAHLECVPVRAAPPRWHRLAQARSLLLGAASSVPMKAAFLYSNDFRKRVQALVEHQHYDSVILNGADLAWILSTLPPSIPRILVAHNIEHLLFQAQIRNLGRLHRLAAGLLRRESNRLREYELQAIRACGNVIFLSREESEFAAPLCGGIRSLLLPPVFDYPAPRRAPRTAGPTLEIGLLGNFQWWPNQLSLRWFSERVLPRVKSPVRLHLFGKPGRHRHFDSRIVEHGVVERLETVWENCDFLICPAVSTEGVSVKLAESIYVGMPVLATRRAARGLPLDDDSAVVFLDEPEEWIEYLNSSAARHLAGLQVARETGAVFSLDAQKNRLHRFVKEVVSGTMLGIQA